MPHILAIDAGGTAVKAGVYDLRGRERALVGEALRPLSSAPGWIERDPAELWRIICRCVRKSVAAAELQPEGIAAIGLTGTGNGLFLLDSSGRPVRNGILSSDQRAAGIVQRWLAEGRGPGHIALTGQQLWAGKPLPLLAWLAEHEPATLARAAHALMGKDVLRYRLTGRLAQEVTDASTASMIDQSARVWTPAVLAHLGLETMQGLFRETVESLASPDPLTADAADALGLAVGTPVAAGAADGHAMMLALGILDDTLLNVTAGTWGLNQLAPRTPTTDGSILASTLGCRPGDHILIDGAPTSASTFEWLVERIIGPTRPLEDRDAVYRWCNEAVAALSEADPPVFFLPYLNGAIDDADARGSFVGLSSWHHLPHMVKAVFEGVAFEHRSHVERLIAGRVPPRAVRFAGVPRAAGPGSRSSPPCSTARSRSARPANSAHSAPPYSPRSPLVFTAPWTMPSRP